MARFATSCLPLYISLMFHLSPVCGCLVDSLPASLLCISVNISFSLPLSHLNTLLPSLSCFSYVFPSCSCDCYYIWAQPKGISVCVSCLPCSTLFAPAELSAVNGNQLQSKALFLAKNNSSGSRGGTRQHLCISETSRLLGQNISLGLFINSGARWPAIPDRKAAGWLAMGFQLGTSCGSRPGLPLWPGCV